METFLIKALQLIMSLAILVLLHELGHFLFARLFKVRVDKFYMFFNPKRSIVRAKKINGKWDVKFFAPNVPANERQRFDANGDLIFDSGGYPLMEQIPTEELPDGDWRKYPENTEWGIGWVPLGGYCKIAGMVDESMDMTQLNKPPQSWEYRSKPTWQRMFIISGGVLMNIVLAVVIYSAILFTWGREYLPLKNMKYGLQYSSVLLDQGFQNGDKIISISDNPVETQAEIIEKILIDGKRKVIVERNGKEELVYLSPDVDQKILASGEINNLISVRVPFVIANVLEGSVADKAAFQSGDSIIGINGKELFIFQDISQELATLKNQSVEIDFVRSGEKKTTLAELDSTGKLGVYTNSYLPRFFETTREEYGFFSSVPAGFALGWETLSSYVKQFKIVFTKEGAKQLSGFSGIGKMFAPVWDWQSFWAMTALLSIILAFMNFLPIPGLDGGHFVFLIYEMITGRKPSDKFMSYATTIGFVLLLLLVVYANGNDIYKFITNKW